MISVSKAATDALAAWLKQSLTPDVRVQSRWPQASVQLKGRTISVIRAGNRVRNDAYGTFQISARTNISATEAKIRIRNGDCRQPLQLDIWCDNYDGRDDLVAQLDQVLHAGRTETLNTKNSVQRNEYRATMSGEAYMPYSIIRIVPRLLAPNLKVQTYQDTPTAPSLTAIPYATTTLHANGTPNPTVTHGTSST